MPLKPEVAAYIAGLVDGEGNIGITTYKATKNGARYRRAQVHITNTDRRCLDFVREAVGYGCVCRSGHWNEPKKNGEPRKPGFRYIVGNAAARKFLQQIRPYLIIKAETADKVLNGPNRGRVSVAG